MNYDVVYCKLFCWSCLFFFFFYVPQLYLWGSPFWVRFLHMWPFFNPTIQGSLILSLWMLSFQGLTTFCPSSLFLFFFLPSLCLLLCLLFFYTTSSFPSSFSFPSFSSPSSFLFLLLFLLLLLLLLLLPSIEPEIIAVVCLFDLFCFAYKPPCVCWEGEGGHVWACAHAHVCEWVCMCVCVYVCVCVHAYLCLYVCVHAYMFTWVRACVWYPGEPDSGLSHVRKVKATGRSGATEVRGRKPTGQVETNWVWECAAYGAHW